MTEPEHIESCLSPCMQIQASSKDLKEERRIPVPAEAKILVKRRRLLGDKVTKTSSAP